MTENPRPTAPAIDADEFARQLENDIRPSRLARYADLFERIPDAIFILDPESLEILDHNESCSGLLGSGEESLVGGKILDRVVKEHVVDFERALRVARRRYRPRVFDSAWQAAGGSKTVEVSACALQLQDQREVIQLIARDVSEIREAKAAAERYLAELHAANEKLATLAVTDELTQLSNVRNFKAVLQKEFDRAQRYKSDFSLIFCDVDNFKHYNDRNGHPAGDAILRGVAAILKEGTRRTDLPARYGGEEFVVLAPETALEGALVLAERLRETIAGRELPHSKEQPLGCVSISVGVAAYPGDGASPEAVLKNADLALYHSKKSGRNRVTAFRALPAS